MDATAIYCIIVEHNRTVERPAAHTTARSSRSVLTYLAVIVCSLINRAAV